MNFARICGAIVLSIALNNPMWADSPLTSATVIGTNVELRAGPSPRYPATGTLRQGERVLVHHEEQDWLAIVPPEGSVSWIKHLFLDQFDPNLTAPTNVVLLGDRVEVRVGSDVDSPPLRITQVKLPRGTIVEVRGDRMEAENTVWYPITPPEGEYRYIRKQAVNLQDSPEVVPPSSIARANASQPPKPRTTYDPRYTGEELSSATSLRSDSSSGGTPRSGEHPLLIAAEEAERRGEWGRAEQLYLQLREEATRGKIDYDQLYLCDNRIHRLRQRLRQGTLTSQRSTRPATSSEQSPIMLRAPESANAVPSTPSRTPSERTTSSSAVARLQSSGPGWLRRSGFFIDGKPAYVLEREDRRFYVTAQPGVQLEWYLNRRVELMGVIMYRGDIRGGNYMSVARASLAR